MMNRIVTLLAIVALLGISTDRVLATNVGAASNMSTIQGAVTGDGIINFDQNGTLTMDANGTGVATISVAAGVAGIIQFNGTTNTIQYAAGAGAITIGAGGSLTIAGTNASAGIDFDTNNNAARLTVNDSIAGAGNANRLIVGNNTLTVSAAATFAGMVKIGGASAILDNDAVTTITFLTLSGASNITPADTMVLTLTNAVALGANTLTITGSGAGGAEAVNGTLTLKNTTRSRCTYTSATGFTVQCDGIDTLGTTFETTTSWQGSCPGSGGSPGLQTDNSTRVDDVIDIEGSASLMTTTSSGTSAEVTISDASAGQSVSMTLVHSNTKRTFAGTSGGNNGLGNGVPRTLTIDTGLAKGTFKAVVQLCVTDSDLSENNLTRESVGLFVFNEAAGEWEVKGPNNRGNAQPTSNVGDHGIFQDGFEKSNACAWAVVDEFSTFIAGEMTTFTLDASASSADSGSVATDPAQTVYSEGMVVNLSATPSSGFEFTEWLIDDEKLATDNPLAITMDQDTVVVGQFDQLDPTEFVLSLTQNDADGGTITAWPQAATYAPGTEVTLPATPADGFVFGGWSGDAAGNDNPLQVTIESNLSIRAA